MMDEICTTYSDLDYLIYLWCRLQIVGNGVGIGAAIGVSSL